MKDILGLYKDIFYNSPVAMCIFDTKGMLIDANKICTDLFGVFETSRINISLFDELTEEQKNSLQKGNEVNCRLPLISNAGTKGLQSFTGEKPEKINLDVSVKSVYVDGNGTDSFYIAVINELSDGSRIEEDLKEIINKIRSLFRVVPTGIGVVVNRVLKEANDLFFEMTGYSREELLGKDDMVLYESPAMYEYVGQENFRQLNTKGMGNVETRFRKKDGDLIDVVLCSCPIDHDDHSKGVVFTALDITERKRHEDQIRMLGSIADSAPAAIIVHKKDGSIIYANEHCFGLYGYTKDEFMQVNLWDLDAKKNTVLHQSRVKELFETGESFFEVIHYRKDGSIIPLHVSAKSIKWRDEEVILSVSNDLTERKKTEEYIRRTLKLESIGTLAGGIAHDFNNLLNIIFGYIDLARSVCSQNSSVFEYLDKAFKGYDRARDLTQQLLTFSRGGSPLKKTGSLTSLLKESVKFALSGSNIVCNFEIDENLWFCDFDKNQMGQVIDNIVINAQQAMPMGGIITITASNISLRHEEHPGLNEGNYIRIVFSDTGIGIPGTILPHVFDPFFTTKKKGNGLGLSTVYSIIKKHDGDIWADSVPGKGTSFYILIPASEEQPASDNTHGYIIHKGSGRVLVMDDEKSILDITRAILTSMGYEVVLAADGEEALELIKNYLETGRSFKAVIMDLTIPGGMGGKRAITELRKIDKEVIVFASSGYSDDPVLSDPGKYGFTDGIPKPYTKKDLAMLFSRHFNLPMV